jgi:hypothetical protein
VSVTHVVVVTMNKVEVDERKWAMTRSCKDDEQSTEMTSSRRR